MDFTQEESFAELSSSTDGQLNIEYELEQFRRQWHDEIKCCRVKDFRETVDLGKESSQDLDSDEPSLEDQARYLFLQGVSAEQCSRLSDAIQYYRKSIQLVPDIEIRMREELNLPNKRDKERTPSESSVEPCEEFDKSDLLDLVEHMKAVRLRDNDPQTCQPNYNTKMTHISALPVEILVYILKWVVSCDLDVYSLEQFSGVCRGFYLTARDDELWKLICRRTWGKNCGRLHPFGSYRRMYIERPHLRFNGCYISKCTYFREGEKSLDNYYRPFHIVEYYRYVRFFPEGKVLMLTTPENPYLTLPSLKTRSSSIQGILVGYYKLVGNTVTLLLKRKTLMAEYLQPTYRYRKHKTPPSDSDQTFEVEFVVGGVAGRPHWQLTWTRYSMRTKYRSTRDEASIDFKLTNESYPNLLFSRVRSFTAASDRPLV